MTPLDSTKEYFVTGVAGFIGFHLASSLLKQGCKVIGLDNLNSYYDVRLKRERLKLLGCERFTFYHADLTDKKKLETIFQRHPITHVVNLAAQAGVRYSIDHPDAYIDSNIQGFLNVLEAIRTHPVEHLVYASSSSVYGKNTKIPYSIHDRTDEPVSLYAATKKANELFAHTYQHLYSIKTTGVRFFTVYGPWGRPDMAYYSFTKKILNNETIDVYNNGDMWRDFTYIDDVINALEHIIPRVPTDPVIYNIGNNNPIRLLRFIEALEEVIGKKANKNFLPMQDGDVYQTYADISDLQRDFGITINTPIEEGLASFVAWYRSYYNV
ncbi:MAG: UDP-glucose 4-epimerase [Spirochaetes bacterium ADurb.Bin315]|jgi:UDP-glucuronate 4-epimerase|nr:MAG: UDP-glucose 4-epimerase [Spirochaetes bacterium ADurb.Bin315]TAH58173.1 MAG: SDR family NAD(P)-dependent oxidoreductase [Sphaerochaeta sp.]HOE88579.1 SDR family NAD(P)-dependent oxidoreductase [Sphaerochaeta sp.]HOR79749.1 SDR family NAD(P)-dependent oxidoreductase [Sphaerochaeta sp.]HPK63256.1 SDR family NAD(P)-dependent oxidoreductase [Sphaerochaeta sp.]